MVNLYISYARKDTEFVQKLHTSLKPLIREGKISVWYDAFISPGEEWSKAIEGAIGRSDIVIAIMSVNYFGSDYIQDVEIPNYMRMYHEGKVKVIPIIARVCTWEDSQIGKFQALPSNGIPVSLSDDIDSSYIHIVQELKKVFESIDKRNKKEHSQNILPTYNYDFAKDNIEPNSSLPKEDLLNTILNELKKINERLFKIENEFNYDNQVFIEKNVDYQVGLSFAGEDRKYVSKVADELLKLQISVFYDEYEEVNLWGKDLYQHLNGVYKDRCQYCVIFISKHYAEKLWTNHELKSAQARAFEENREYILPARFDNTEIVGLNNTVGYVECNKHTPTELAKKIFDKVRVGK